MSLKVNEIFYSIQGESSYAGRPCVFIRLTGCNLRCSYCDTKYAYNQGEERDIPEIMENVRQHMCHLVEVTGGEPLLQEDTHYLLEHLLDEDFEVLLETNGSKDISRVDRRCIKIVDIKCPSSGEVGRNDLKNLYRLSENDELKFIIGDRRDYEYAKGILNLIRIDILKGAIINFSPSFGKMEPEELSDWIIKDKLNVRLNLQLHKYIWGPDKRGV